MFTGIVEEIGKVTSWQQGSQTCRLTISCKEVLAGSRLGDSIAVNGVCLTAAHLSRDSFTADILTESLRKTALVQLKTGHPVNLERALQVGGRLGGHWVTGHIDGVGKIADVFRERNSLWYTIELPHGMMDYLVPKGSIALDGTSLTIAKLEDRQVTVSLIPHTAQETILGLKGAGDLVNVETDILGKYVHRFMSKSEEPKAEDKLSLEKLRSLGFV